MDSALGHSLRNLPTARLPAFRMFAATLPACRRAGRFIRVRWLCEMSVSADTRDTIFAPLIHRKQEGNCSFCNRRKLGAQSHTQRFAWQRGGGRCLETSLRQRSAFDQCRALEVGQQFLRCLTLCSEELGIHQRGPARFTFLHALCVSWSMLRLGVCEGPWGMFWFAEFSVGWTWSDHFCEGAWLWMVEAEVGDASTWPPQADGCGREGPLFACLLGEDWRRAEVRIISGSTCRSVCGRMFEGVLLLVGV